MGLAVGGRKTVATGNPEILKRQALRGDSPTAVAWSVRRPAAALPWTGEGEAAVGTNGEKLKSFPTGFTGGA
jgi:hypothetical protein